MEALDKAIVLLKGETLLAKALGIVPSAVFNWKSRGRVPAQYCPSIEKLTGGKVRCEHLRPDVAWGVLRRKVAA